MRLKFFQGLMGWQRFPYWGTCPLEGGGGNSPQWGHVLMAEPVLLFLTKAMKKIISQQRFFIEENRTIIKHKLIYDAKN